MSEKQNENEVDLTAKQDLIESIKDQIAQILKNEEVELATVVFTVKGGKEPQIYRKGHFYDTTQVLQQVMSAYRAKIAMDLGL